VQGALLAVMSVLVFVLPLYQLWLGLRNPVNIARAKATQSFRDIRKRLSDRSGVSMPAGPDLPEAGGREQARLQGRAGVFLVCAPLLAVLRVHLAAAWPKTDRSTKLRRRSGS
jgi:hypothetical protein